MLDHLTDGVERDSGKSVETETNTFSQKTQPMSRLRSRGLCGSYNTGEGPSSKKRPATGPKKKSKAHGGNYVSSKPVAQLFASKQAREEELKNKATSNLNAVYGEIRPAVEAHDLDSQDEVPTSMSNKWMDATCDKWKAEMNFSFSVIKNVMFPPRNDDNTEAKGSKGEGVDK